MDHRRKGGEKRKRRVVRGGNLKHTVAFSWWFCRGGLPCRGWWRRTNGVGRGERVGKKGMTEMREGKWKAAEGVEEEKRSDGREGKIDEEGGRES